MTQSLSKASQPAEQPQAQKTEPQSPLVTNSTNEGFTSFLPHQKQTLGRNAKQGVAAGTMSMNHCSLDSLAQAQNQMPTMTSDEMEHSQTRPISIAPLEYMGSNATHGVAKTSEQRRSSQIHVMPLDSSFSSRSHSLHDTKNSARELSFLFEDGGSPEVPTSPKLPSMQSRLEQGEENAIDHKKKIPTQKQSSTDQLKMYSPVQLNLQLPERKQSLAEQSSTEQFNTGLATKTTGMRRIKRFLNLEERSGRLSSSRGTSPDFTNSSQASDVYQFMRTTSMPGQAAHMQLTSQFTKKQVQKTRSSNFDDSLGIESLKSSKLTSQEEDKTQALKRRQQRQQAPGMRILFNPPQPGVYSGIQGSIISPSSAQHQPQSLGLILKAALAEQDYEVTSGREFQFSEDFSRLDKSGVLPDRENLSSVFSQINSVKGDETQIVRTEPFLMEESILSDEDEITEDFWSGKNSNSGGTKGSRKAKALKPKQTMQIFKPEQQAPLLSSFAQNRDACCSESKQEDNCNLKLTTSHQKRLEQQFSSHYNDSESYSFDIWPWQGAGDSDIFGAHDFCECQCVTPSHNLLCEQCGRPAQQVGQKCLNQARSSNKFKINEEKVNSNEVPKHRHKRMFMLQNYISESEGVISNAAKRLDFGHVDQKMTEAKSNFFQDKLNTRALDQKSNTNRSRQIRTMSQHFSLMRYQSNNKLTHNQSMGWIGELSSMVLSMGQKLIKGTEKSASDSAFSEVVKLEFIDETYQPADLNLIEQTYQAVEPSDLISKQQTTMIYLAQTTTNQEVVLKTVDKEKIGFSELALTFAKRESVVHSQMDHPNIVKAFHYGETDKHYCIYMEYAGYGSDYLSRKVLGKNKPIKDSKLAIWAQDVLHGLWYMHQRGVIHTDIKVDNILIFKGSANQASGAQQDPDEIPVAKICDFGLCHVIDPSKKMAFMEVLVGTPDYQAPEMADKTWISTSVDMWAFGIVLYELAVGYKPRKIKHLNLPLLADGIPYFKKNWVQKDPQLIDLIRRCLQQNPKDRITAEEALQHPYFTYYDSQDED